MVDAVELVGVRGWRLEVGKVGLLVMVAKGVEWRSGSKLLS
jgi:hypothetical protein